MARACGVRLASVAPAHPSPHPLLARWVDFGRALRRAGVPIDSARMALALQALDCVGVGARADAHAALRCVLVSRQADLAVFDALFEAFYRAPTAGAIALSTPGGSAEETADLAPARSREAWLGLANETDAAPDEAVQSDAAMTASARERLHQADFQSLSASEYRAVLHWAKRIRLPMPEVPARRTRAARRGHRLDAARTLQEAARHEGEVFRLLHRVRRAQPLPLLLLVDVSGSMARYARVLLAFLHQATRRLPRATFAISTRLTDLRAAFAHEDPDAMLAAVNRSVPDYASGTRLGEALEALRREHPQVLSGRRTCVLLISDGLDTGDPALLHDALGWVKRHSRSLLWLNPLLRFEGYAPKARGAQVLHRQADAMLAVHNLVHLEQFARALAELVQAPRKPFLSSDPLEFSHGT